jgi:mRNA interferase HigB
VRIISKKKIREYSKDNVQASLPLTEWYMKMLACDAKTFAEMKKKFNGVDFVYDYTIFDIGGNNYRLITAIHYNTQLCYIREIWTHAEYSKPYNQIKLKRGEL